ncbi:MAG: DNA polymerase IV [Lachnospiraceae bacterium]|nr:DNA polymerase IV [Lachnospiraceae bacterium]
MESIIFHIDVNSAFLSWTAVKLLNEGYGSDIRLVPAIIGGDQESRHGIVVAASIPAKRMGIKTAEPVAQSMKKCPDLLMFPPEHKYYQTQSRKLMTYLSEICPVIEQVSIDECYMSFDPISTKFDSPEAAAYFIKDSVKEKFGFTVNVGISDRKVLAKMASDLEKPDKVHTLFHNQIEEIMWPLPISDLFMCGKSASSKLTSMGINTIGDFAKCDEKLVESWLKSHGKLIWNFANGIDDSVVNTKREKVKGVGNSVTLSMDLTDATQAKKVLEKLTHSVVERMKKKSVLAASVCVEIKYSSFKSVSHQKAMNYATDKFEDLIDTVYDLFDELWDGEPIRLLGVRTTKLTYADEPRQINLFEFQDMIEKDEKKQKIEDAVKSINNKFGEGSIVKGTDGL